MMLNEPAGKPAYREREGRELGGFENDCAGSGESRADLPSHRRVSDGFHLE